MWRDPNTAPRERKRMLALLIEDVTLLKQRQITAAVRFRGGATTTLTLPRPLTALYTIIWRLVISYYTIGFGSIVFTIWVRRGLKGFEGEAAEKVLNESVETVPDFLDIGVMPGDAVRGIAVFPGEDLDDYGFSTIFFP